MRRGFTLIESLVAVVLLGVGVAACVACLGTATRASSLAEEYTAVQLMAREKLAEIAAGGGKPGEDTGDFGEERPGFGWRALTEPSETPGLNRVTLTLAWGREEAPRRAEFVTFVRETAR